MSESSILQVLISLGILLFAAKMLGSAFHRLKQSAVLGEIIAGIVIGPFALGGLPILNGQPLVVLDETMLNIGEISAIVILFVAGMQTTPREFLKLGAPSFTVGSLGVIAPFFIGYFLFTALGVEPLPAILVATALTATSIAISVQVLSELGRLQSREGRMILGAAVADDVLAIAVLSVVLNMVSTGNINLEITNVFLTILMILGLYAGLLVASVLAIPRLLNIQRLWRPAGSVEAAATAACFAVSGAAAFMGLSPVVGAFAAGMAATAAKAVGRIRDYAEKLNIVFAPLFFAIIGARVDLRGFDLDVFFLALLIIAVAVVSKLFGCGLPSMIFLKEERRKWTKVGIGMISRGEVGLIVAAAGASAGILTGNLYTTVVIMVAASTVITPVWLKAAYRKEPPAPATVMEKEAK